ncbi:MAG: 16S rRNA (uracil(1498)-N(3))-methyltransferase [Lachnospiraceae bacterium]|nr:16S rRNA (uracil(1498)-N(3))-methyltransferase [Lachnospiraceae bacterium]
MHMFFVEPRQIVGGQITITGPDVNHIRNVLRMKPGEMVRVSDEKDFCGQCRVEELLEDQILLTILEEADSTELPAQVTLFQGLPKGDKMEWIIQKNTELGIARIVPVVMKRSVVKLDAKKAATKVARWQAIAESAGKQSGRTKLPEVAPVMTYAQALKEAADYDLLLLPYESAEGMDAVRSLFAQAAPGMRIGILIGPEGGFEPSEVEAAVAAGWKVLSLGRRILRTETAGMTVMANLMLQLEP